MAALLPCLLCLWLLAGTLAVKFHKCPLAKILEEEGLDGYAGIFLEEWMCIAYHSSGYDTKKSWYGGFGLFQLNLKYWCKVPGKDSQNNCNMCCNKLQDDDLSDDVTCLKKIVRSSRSLDLFRPWKTRCKEENIPQWLNDCKRLNRRWQNIS